MDITVANSEHVSQFNNAGQSAYMYILGISSFVYGMVIWQVSCILQMTMRSTRKSIFGT